jgi:hypothetical protein
MNGIISKRTLRILNFLLALGFYEYLESLEGKKRKQY